MPLSGETLPCGMSKAMRGDLISLAKRKGVSVNEMARMLIDDTLHVIHNNLSALDPDAEKESKIQMSIKLYADQQDWLDKQVFTFREWQAWGGASGILRALISFGLDIQTGLEDEDEGES